MSDGFRSFQLKDKDFGEIKLVVITPLKGDPWGMFAPLRDTVWGAEIDVVSGTAMSYALHGLAYHLMRELKRPPEGKFKKVLNETTEEEHGCKHRTDCIGYDKAHCRPVKTVPECYQGSSPDPAINALVNHLVRWWKDGKYVLVVEGDQFVI